MRNEVSHGLHDHDFDCRAIVHGSVTVRDLLEPDDQVEDAAKPSARLTS
jgi:hypothetical protein